MKTKNKQNEVGKLRGLLLASLASLLCLFAVPLRGQPVAESDSLLVFRYPSRIQMFKENYKDNRLTLRKFKKRMRSFHKRQDTLYVYSFSGDWNTKKQNLRTAYWRANNLKGYLINFYGLRERHFKTATHPSAHPSWGEVVLLGFTPMAFAATVKAEQPEAAVKKEQPEAAVKAEQPEATVKAEQPEAAVEKEQPEVNAAETPPTINETPPIINETPPIIKEVEAEKTAGAKTETVAQPQPPRRWYAGIEAGIPFGISTFSSFAHSKTYGGFTVGATGGYRFSPLLSVELGVSFGKMRLASGACCEDYWLASDGNRYLAPVAGLNSYSYADIYSSVAMQQYALRMNVDLLQILKPHWQKRWSLHLSPAIVGMHTCATLKERNTDRLIVERDGQFRFGAGVGIGAQYRVTSGLGIGLRSGAIWVIGDRFDGIQPTDHHANLLWNNTITLFWHFNSNK